MTTDLADKIVARRSEFTAAQPFPHIVLDDLLPPEHHAAVLEAFDEEDAAPLQDEIIDALASKVEPEHAAFIAFRNAFNDARMLDAVGQLTGVNVSRADARAFAYQPGHYLLPHADDAADGSRVLAYAYYAALVDDVTGGELVLYGCKTEDRLIVETRVAKTIEPRDNRIVLMAVGPTTVHQVNEVITGTRLSIAGWFYR